VLQAGCGPAAADAGTRVLQGDGGTPTQLRYHHPRCAAKVHQRVSPPSGSCSAGQNDHSSDVHLFNLVLCSPQDPEDGRARPCDPEAAGHYEPDPGRVMQRKPGLGRDERTGDAGKQADRRPEACLLLRSAASCCAYACQAASVAVSKVHGAKQGMLRSRALAECCFPGWLPPPRKVHSRSRAAPSDISCAQLPPYVVWWLRDENSSPAARAARTQPAAARRSSKPGCCARLF
jgi:hypothetical protein